MKKATLMMVAAVAIVTLTQACASSHMAFEPANLDADKYVRKIDQFVVVADGSQSMGDRSNAERKLDIAEAFLASLNQTVPEMAYEGALRTFGRGSCDVKGKTVLLAGAASALERLQSRQERRGSVTLLAVGGSVRIQQLEIEGLVRRQWLFPRLRAKARKAFQALDPLAR